MSRRVAVGLAALAGLLVTTLALEYQAFQQDPGPMPLPSLASPALQAENATFPADRSQDWVAIILDRPLFNVSRRPPPGAAAAASRGTGLPRLSGILVAASQRRAIFAGPAGSKPVVIAEGAKLGGYTVQSIGGGQVTLAGPAGTVVLRPAFDAAAPSPATAVPDLFVPEQADRQSLLDRVRNGPAAAGRTNP